MFGDKAKVAAEGRRRTTWVRSHETAALMRDHKISGFYQLFLGWHPQNEMFFIWKK